MNLNRLNDNQRALYGLAKTVDPRPGMATKTYHCIRKLGIETIEELEKTDITEFVKVPNCGSTVINIVRQMKGMEVVRYDKESLARSRYYKTTRMDKARRVFDKRYHEHRDSYIKTNPYSMYAEWTLQYEKDWEFIRRLTLHMFDCSTVDQLEDYEVDKANEIAIGFINYLFDNVNEIGHCKDEIRAKLGG